MIQKILFSQPRPATEHNPYTRLEAQFDVQCDFYQFIHIEGLEAREFRQQRINPLDYTVYLQKFIQYRKRKVFFPESGNRFEDLLPAMHRRPNEKYMMVVSDIHTNDQINMFAENGIQVTPAVMYRTVTTPWPADKPFDYDLIALFTPAGAKALQENFPDWKQGDTLIAAFGEGTIRALQDEGYRVDIEAGQGKEFASLPMAIADYLEKNQ